VWEVERALVSEVALELVVVLERQVTVAVWELVWEPELRGNLHCHCKS
jgi:hypothetical protein